MVEQKHALVKHVVKGQVHGLSRELGFVDPEILEEQREEAAVDEWVEAMAQEATMTEAERLKRWLEEEAKLPRIRPHLTRDPIPENIQGLAELGRWVWGDEMQTMALVFVAGKERFAHILPPDAQQARFPSQSPAGELAIYIMIVSSLYWAREDGTITDSETDEYAQRITSLYELNEYRDSFCATDMFRHTVDHYHRTGWYYVEMEKERDNEAMKVVRQRLHDQPLIIPAQLNKWIYHPLSLFTDFGREVPEDEGLKRVREIDRQRHERIKGRNAEDLFR